MRAYVHDYTPLYLVVPGCARICLAMLGCVCVRARVYVAVYGCVCVDDCVVCVAVFVWLWLWLCDCVCGRVSLCAAVCGCVCMRCVHGGKCELEVHEL